MCYKLLNKKHPHISGLQDPVLGQKLQFDVCPNKFVQILHDVSGHWITVANMSDYTRVVVYSYTSARRG